jgi:hypothetical protein
MTNLRQRLQAWADRGVFKFPEGDDKGGFTADLNDPEGLYMKGEGTELVVNPQMQWAIEMVLGGIIPVWRPVEHYKPKDNEPVFLYDLNYSTEPLIGYYRSDDGQFHKSDVRRNFMTLVSPTHYQPLPPPPKEGE